MTCNSSFAERYLRVVSPFDEKREEKSGGKGQGGGKAQRDATRLTRVFVVRRVQGETNTQVPNGIGQSVLAGYLSPQHGWGESPQASSRKTKGRD